MTVCHIVPLSLGKRVSKSHREVVEHKQGKGSSVIQISDAGRRQSKYIQFEKM
jgi:hypothetical protein